MLRPVIIPNVIGSSVDAATVDAFFDDASSVNAFSVDGASVNVLSDGASSVDAAFVNALSDDAFSAVDAFSSDKAFSAVLQELKHTLNHQKAFSCFTPLPGPWLKHIFGLPCG